jgi:hypothetical protein
MTLPDDSVLLRNRDLDGLDYGTMAALYDVSISDVIDRFEAMGRYLSPEDQKQQAEKWEQFEAAMDAFRSTGADPEGLVRLARQRGWRAGIIHQRTGVDHDTIARVLSEAG